MDNSWRQEGTEDIEKRLSELHVTEGTYILTTELTVPIKSRVE